MSNLTPRCKDFVRKYLHAVTYFSLLTAPAAVKSDDYSVSSNGDSITDSTTLRYAIEQGNNAPGSHTISFSPPSSSFNIVLGFPLPPIGPNFTSISANNCAITIDGGGDFQAFTILPNANCSFIGGPGPSPSGSFQIINAYSIGGSGGGGGGISDDSNGGGGALGAGGGLFVAQNAIVTINGVSFSGCGARGGNGASIATSGFIGGGGGGGMCLGDGGFAQTVPAHGGGGGGGYGGKGGVVAGSAGSGGGGLNFNGGNSPNVLGSLDGAGGGGSDANAGSNGTSLAGGAGGTGITGTGGAGGTAGMPSGGAGTGSSGGGGGFDFAGNGGDSAFGAGGGGGNTASAPGGNGGSCTGLLGGGGGGGVSPGVAGGAGGNGGGFGGGGGGGAGSVSSPGGNGGPFGGGGGGNGVLLSTEMNQGNGGFGAGGGGGYTQGSHSTSGKGGYGAQNGAAVPTGQNGGGGGAAFGGSIFISQGATLNWNNPVQATLSSAGLLAGVGGNGVPAIPAPLTGGQDIFIMSSGTINFQNSTTLTISTAIESDAGGGGGSTAPTAGGVIMSGTGTLSFTDTVGPLSQPYTGSTTIQNTGTIQIVRDYNLGASSNPLNFSAGGGTLSLSNAVDSTRTVNLTAGGTFYTASGVSTWGGSFTGAGGFTKTGPGALALSNLTNTLASTTIAAGTLQISDPGNIGSNSISFGTGTLELLSGFASATLTNALNLTGSDAALQSDVAFSQSPILSGPVTNSGTSTLHVYQTTPSTLTFSNSITGATSLAMHGPGTLLLTGGNAYTGSTTLFSGTIQISSDGNLGASSSPINFNGVGTLILSSAIDSNRAVNLGANGTLYTTSGLSTWGGSFTGAGELIKAGPGTLYLSGSSNNPGGIQIAEGTLQISAPGGVGSNGISFGNGTLELLSGFGSATLTSPLNLTGLDAAISSSVAVGQSPILSGTIANSGASTLHVYQDEVSTLTLFGSMTGATSLAMHGPGTLTLTGAKAYTGSTDLFDGILTVSSGSSVASTMPFNINAGRAIINGSVASPVLVDVGATLSGTGSVGATTINGTIAPGNSIGTLSGTSFLFNPTSLYSVEFNGSTSDRINAAGSVTIDGGTVQLVPVGFTTAQVTKYTLISAANVVVNTPFQLNNPLPLFPFFLEYLPTSVLLTFTQPPTPDFPSVLPAGNASAVARCFQKMVDSGNPNITGLVDIFKFQTVSELISSFTQMEPTNFNTFSLAEENVVERIRQTYTHHFLEQEGAACADKDLWKMWATPFIERVKQHGNHKLPGYVEQFSGFSTGLDYRFPHHWVVSGGFSFAEGKTRVPGAHTNNIWKTYAGTLATAWIGKHLFVDAQAIWGYTHDHAKRTMDFSVTSQLFSNTLEISARHKDHSNQLLGHIGSGWRWNLYKSSLDTLNWYPFANLDYVHLFQSRYKEHGAGAINLKVRSKDYDLLRPEAGLGLEYKGCFDRVSLGLDLSASYTYEFRFHGRDTRASFVQENCSFTVRGLKPQNSLISPEARFQISVPAHGCALTLGYHGEYGKHFILNAGEVELKKSF